MRSETQSENGAGRVRGQASIEFLLLLAAGLAILSTFAFAWNKTLWLAQASAETAKARSFADRLSASSNELAILADGTRKTISAGNSVEWRVFAKGGRLEVSFGTDSESGQFSKSVSAGLSQKTEDFDFFLEPHSSTSLELSGGAVKAYPDP